jgi:pimeloyl-ACP methyl ester carboxylesterase
VARVLAPDLRGHGMSEAGDQPVSMAVMADDCMGLLEAVGVQEPVVVCGLSMGGYVAFEFYRQFPEWVAGLILVSTRAGADTPAGRNARDKMIALAEEEGSTAIAAEILPKLMAPTSYNRNGELIDFVRDMMEGTSTDGMIGALEAMKDRPDSTSLLPQIDVPTLIIHGEDDQLIPVAEAEAMWQAIPAASLVIIPDAGHVPNLEQPDAFNEVVWDFLQGLQDEDA